MRRESAIAPRATVYTLADARFYIGVVALLNSLRLTGHNYPFVVLDCGLEPAQRACLRRHAVVIELPEDVAARKVLAKPYVDQVHEGKGAVVWIDSDVIVTGSLASLVASAEQGFVCAYPVEREFRARRFDDWTDIYGLAMRPRHQVYINAGVLAFSPSLQPRLLQRWGQACERTPPGSVWRDGPDEHTWAGDQDALNAVLMTEIPAQALRVMPESEVAFPPDIERVRVVDEQTLACTLDGRPVRILHYTWVPKPWAPLAWRRMEHPLRDAYVKLLPRLLFSRDVLCMIEPGDVPFWVRPGALGAVSRTTVGLARPMRRAVARVVEQLPAPIRDPLVRMRDRLEPPER